MDVKLKPGDMPIYHEGKIRGVFRKRQDVMDQVEWVEHVPGNNSDPLNQVHTLGWRFYVTPDGKTAPEDGFGAWTIVVEGQRDEIHKILEGELSVAQSKIEAGQYRNLLTTWTSNEDDPIRRTVLSRAVGRLAKTIQEKIDERSNS